MIGEIDRASADGHQSVQWEICGPEGADGEHPRWGGGVGRGGHLRRTYLERTVGGPLSPRSELSSSEHKTSLNGRLKHIRGCGH